MENIVMNGNILLLLVGIVAVLLSSRSKMNLFTKQEWTIFLLGFELNSMKEIDYTPINYISIF